MNDFIATSLVGSGGTYNDDEGIVFNKSDGEDKKRAFGFMRKRVKIGCRNIKLCVYGFCLVSKTTSTYKTLSSKL